MVFVPFPYRKSCMYYGLLILLVFHFLLLAFIYFYFLGRFGHSYQAKVIKPKVIIIIISFEPWCSSFNRFTQKKETEKHLTSRNTVRIIILRYLEKLGCHQHRGWLSSTIMNTKYEFDYGTILGS